MTIQFIEQSDIERINGLLDDALKEYASEFKEIEYEEAELMVALENGIWYIVYSYYKDLKFSTLTK